MHQKCTALHGQNPDGSLEALGVERVCKEAYYVIEEGSEHAQGTEFALPVAS